MSEDASRSDHSQRIGDSALEIVREAYKISQNSKILAAKDLDFAQNYLRDSCEGDNDVFEDLEVSLGDSLHKLVEQEIDTIGNLTPVQIINHYAPESKFASEQAELLGMAQRIAHIAVLHWRVWAPMIYKQPLGPTFEEGSVSPGRHPSRTIRSVSNEVCETRRGSAIADM